jgi:hypothetical protein
LSRPRTSACCRTSSASTTRVRAWGGVYE